MRVFFKRLAILPLSNIKPTKLFRSGFPWQFQKICNMLGLEFKFNCSTDTLGVHTLIYGLG